PPGSGDGGVSLLPQPPNVSPHAMHAINAKGATPARRATTARRNISGIIRYDTAVRAFPSPLVAAAIFVCALTANDAHAQLRSRVYASGFSVPVAFVPDPTDRTVQVVV